MKVYGPYTRKDGRKHVILYDGVTRKTVSYPKWLMEQHLGRKLGDWEEVDHINEDYTDDRIENFQILTKPQNIKKSKYKQRPELCCVWCGKNFTRKRFEDKRAKTGPYCTRTCSGKALYSGTIRKHGDVAQRQRQSP